MSLRRRELAEAISIFGRSEIKMAERAAKADGRLGEPYGRIKTIIQKIESIVRQGLSGLQKPKKAPFCKHKAENC